MPLLWLNKVDNIALLLPMTHQILSHILFRIFVIGFLGIAAAFPMQVAQAQSIQTDAKQAIVIDYDTGMTLYSKNADGRMPTSSMSKVMTMYVVFDAIQKGKVSLNDQFLVSEKAWRKQGSKMFVEVDKKVRVEDLIRGVIIQSGNDATIVLAEGLAGTEEAFADLLNYKAQELGMTNSHFMNASGWPDDNHYSTARDLATLGVKLIENFPEYYGYYSETEFTYNDITQENRNPLLYRNLGADGIKTGHTEVGGYGLIGSGKRDGRRVVIVINGLDSSKARANESAKLLDWGLRSFVNKKIVSAGAKIAEFETAYGRADTVAVGLSDDVVLSVPKLQGEGLDIKVTYDGPITAPVQKGDVLGEMQITIPGQETAFTYDVKALNSIEELGFFAKTVAKAKNFIAKKI